MVAAAAEPPPLAPEVIQTGSLPAIAADLYLEVVLNGVPTHLIANFKQRPNGRLASPKAELTQIGLKVADASAGKDGVVELDAIPGLVYGFDPASQTVMIDATDEALIPHEFDLRAGTELPVETSTGAVLNYTLFASSSADYGFGAEDGVASGQFDGRFFSRYGVFTQSGIVGTGIEQDSNVLRLDTAWTYSDPKSLIAYRAGDMITGSLAWTRAVRLGGFQLRRNFGLRPDLITMPAPAFAGSAAVPSSLEVYANNIQVFSEQVAPGPFAINNLPVITGAGEARLVVSDSLGRRTETSLPFYASSDLLRRGLSDFSCEIGLPRTLYGVESNAYSDEIAASASGRYGLTDRLTLEGHAEADPEIFNAGAGMVFPLKAYGLASVAAAGSAGDAVGGQLSASLELGFRKVRFNMRATGTLGAYEDVASTAIDPRSIELGYADQFRPPKTSGQATLSFPLGFDSSSLSLNYADIVTADGARSRTVGMGWERQIFGSASLHATGFVSLDGEEDYGLYVGVSVPLGERLSAEASVWSESGRVSAGVDAVRSETAEPGSFGWRIRDREGEITDRLASLSYTGSKARVAAGIEQLDGVTHVDGQIDGALVMAGGGAFLSRRIDDSFAIVETGAPDVAVLHENRPVGVTDARGKLLVTGLNAYQRNALSIDPNSLPVDAEIEQTSSIVVPADRSAVVAKFGVAKDTASALVSFRDSAGAGVPPGSKGRVADAVEDFVVGYDGEAFLRGLKAANTLQITTPEGQTCAASFAFAPRAGAQVRIDGVTCK